MAAEQRVVERKRLHVPHVGGQGQLIGQHALAESRHVADGRPGDEDDQTAAGQGEKMLTLYQAACLVRQRHHRGEDIGVMKEAVETKLPARAGPMEARLAGERVPCGHVSA